MPRWKLLVWAGETLATAQDISKWVETSKYLRKLILLVLEAIKEEKDREEANES